MSAVAFRKGVLAFLFPKRMVWGWQLEFKERRTKTPEYSYSRFCHIWLNKHREDKDSQPGRAACSFHHLILFAS